MKEQPKTTTLTGLVGPLKPGTKSPFPKGFYGEYSLNISQRLKRRQQEADEISTTEETDSNHS